MNERGQKHPRESFSFSRSRLPLLVASTVYQSAVKEETKEMVRGAVRAERTMLLGHCHLLTCAKQKLRKFEKWVASTCVWWHHGEASLIASVASRPAAKFKCTSTEELELKL